MRVKVLVVNHAETPKLAQAVNCKFLGSVVGPFKSFRNGEIEFQIKYDAQVYLPEVLRL